jgi:hypothetical protein
MAQAREERERERRRKREGVIPPLSLGLFFQGEKKESKQRGAGVKERAMP